MIPIPPLIALNYAVLSTLALYFDYYFINSVCELRHRYSPLIYWGYMISNSLVDGYLAYLTEYGDAGYDIGPMRAVWVYVTAIAAFCVICCVWKGDPVQVGVSAVMADLIASITSTLGLLSANLITGVDPWAGYVRPFSGHTILTACLMLAGFLVIRVSATSIMRTVARAVRRHRLVWAVVAILFVATFSSVSPIGYAELAPWFSIIPIMELLAASAFALVLLRKSRDVTRRDALMSQCLAAANSYETLVGEHLRSLERDLTALEGHEESLERLRATQGGALDERVGKLREAYERLKAGSFGERPALDAVLMSGAERLRGMGVQPEFSVAGLATSQPVDVPLVMSLLNLACAEAAQQDGIAVEGAKVGLRLRGIGRGVLYRLDVPASWGWLGARRSLSALPEFETLLVKERVHDGRSVVLVVEGVGEQ